MGSFFMRFSFPRNMLAAASLLAAMTATPGQAKDIDPAGFPRWMEGLKAEAKRKGVSELILDAAFKGVRADQKVVALDRRQAEFTENIWTYLEKRTPSMTVGKGRRLYNEHRALLQRIEKEFGVPGRFLIAFWGMETGYGSIYGSHRLTQSLATLAYDKRRAGFFRKQLLTLLTLMEQGHIPVDAKGSWAGAMGNMQFIPTTYQAYAIDFDGDGKRDLWGSIPDSLASAANFLRAAGWDKDLTWGREVKLPKNFNVRLASLKIKKSLPQWSRLGVMKADGSPLPKVDVPGSIILPSGIKGPAFMVYHNFNVIMNWNRAQLYAVAVGHLADRIAGGGTLRTPRDPDIIIMSRGEIVQIQKGLTALGFQVGEADGVLGSQTREAVRQFQHSVGLPADGHATPELLKKIQQMKASGALAQ